MPCEYCRQSLSHHPGCPLAKLIKAKHYCSVCEEGILNGEDCIENDNGEFVHYDCVEGTRWLANWLGYEVREMDDGEY